MEEKYVALAIPFFFVLIGLELLVTEWRARRRTGGERAYSFQDSINNLSCGIGQQVLEPLLPVLRTLSTAPLRLLPVRNRFFGGNIAVTGLLTGRDVSDAFGSEPVDDRYLLPDVVLSRDRFLDGLAVTDLPRAVEVVPTDGASLVAALRDGANEET